MRNNIQERIAIAATERASGTPNPAPKGRADGFGQDACDKVVEIEFVGEEVAVVCKEVAVTVVCKELEIPVLVIGSIVAFFQITVFLLSQQDAFVAAES